MEVAVFGCNSVHLVVSGEFVGPKIIVALTNVLRRDTYNSALKFVNVCFFNVDCVYSGIMDYVGGVHTDYQPVDIQFR